MIARVAVLVDPAARAHDRVPSNMEAEARALGVQLQRVEAGAPDAFEGAFAAMVQGRAETLIIMDVPRVCLAPPPALRACTPPPAAHCTRQKI
jgi:hypothetical protein